MQSGATALLEVGYDHVKRMGLEGRDGGWTFSAMCVGVVGGGVEVLHRRVGRQRRVLLL